MEKTLSAAASFVPLPFHFSAAADGAAANGGWKEKEEGRGRNSILGGGGGGGGVRFLPPVYSSWAIACQRKRGKEGRGEVSCPPLFPTAAALQEGVPSDSRLAAAVLQHRDGGGGLVQPRHRTYTGTEKEELLRLLSLVSTPCAQAPTDGPSSECRKRERRKETKWEEE